jgi:hypothetical protein
MAYMSQERKAAIAPQVKEICKKYGVKASLSVRNHSTLVLNIKQGEIDFINNFNQTVQNRPGGFRNGGQAEKSIQVNTYWYHEHFSGVAKSFLQAVLQVMNSGNHDNSDAMTDYFDVGWYVDVNIGKWNQPYALVK